mgnify:FL=1
MSNKDDRHLDDKIIRIKARFALLYVLGEMGAYDREIKAQDVYKPAARLLGLTEREQTITIQEKNGVGEDRPWWPNAIQWARDKLNKIGALAPSTHGYWRLSERGLKQYQQLLDQFKNSDMDFEHFVEAFVSQRREARRSVESR